MAKVNLDSLKSAELEKRLGKTIYNGYKNLMREYIAKGLRNGGYFSVPVIQSLVDEKSALGKKLIDLYDRKIILDGDTYISNEMKILQASAFDGLVVGINTEKANDWGIYTANTGVIFGLDSGSKFDIGKTIEMNQQGIVNAVRIDVTYTSEEGFEYKPVSLNKNTNLKVVDLETGSGRFFLVPYLAIQMSMAFFKEQLDDGRILEVLQEKDGLNKIRYISTRPNILAKYTDSKEFAESLKAEYFPLKGFFYAPVLGAGSLSVGRTRIDVVDVAKVGVTSNPKVASVPQDSLDVLVVESTLQKYLVELYEDIEKYASLVSELPKVHEYFDVMNDTPNPVTIMKYYHQLGKKENERFWKVILNSNSEFMKEAHNCKALMTNVEYLDVKKYSNEDIKNMLKNGIYKFIIRKKDCEYSSMVVTNNEECLKKLYGDDYFGKYESLGARLYKLEEMVSKNNSPKAVKEALAYCNLEKEGVAADKEVIKVLSSHDPKKSTHERLAEIFKSEDIVGKGVRKSSTGDSILVRKCFASLNGSGAVDYYRYLDISKVVSMVRLG